MGDITAIVFDLGNVVFDISFDKMYRYWAERKGIDAARLKERLVFDEMYCKFERGEIDPDEYRDYAIDKLGVEMDYAEFDRGWNNIYLDILPGIGELVESLRFEHQLCVLTNTNEIHESRWREQYASVLQHFAHIFSSFEMGARKPETRIFTRMLKALETEPERVVFFDDKAENVESAVACGIRGFRIDTCEHIRQTLTGIGILPG